MALKLCFLGIVHTKIKNQLFTHLYLLAFFFETHLNLSSMDIKIIKNVLSIKFQQVVVSRPQENHRKSNFKVVLITRALYSKSTYVK